ncbi:hypothetical protein FRC00_002917 [Tulasnella sp. 408]|nr:hypothetical protein FRC00_002917 [Tulasnella sp. 408]
MVRIAIEDEYAKKLVKLAQLPLGTDEIGLSPLPEFYPEQLARDKYETDYLRINSYTAQSALLQGIDGPPAKKQCQDLEDEGIEFIKDQLRVMRFLITIEDILQSCERIRVQLEKVDSDKELENFVKDYGTGPMMSEPMPFI